MARARRELQPAGPGLPTVTISTRRDRRADGTKMMMRETGAEGLDRQADAESLSERSERPWVTHIVT